MLSYIYIYLICKQIKFSAYMEIMHIYNIYIYLNVYIYIYIYIAGDINDINVRILHFKYKFVL